MRARWASRAGQPGGQPGGGAGLFALRDRFEHPIIGRYLEFARQHGIEIAGFEFIETADGRLVTYDINTAKRPETSEAQLPARRYCNLVAGVPRLTRNLIVQGREAMADPRARIARIRAVLTPREWARAGAMTATVIGLNVLGWGMLSAAVGGHYHLSGTKLFGFGTGVLAYTLGMRHAFDADHIAAIDNTTRKLVNDGKRPLSVGFFFSLGHSSIVFVLALLLNFGIRALDNQVGDTSSGLHTVTGIVGTTVSGTFLYLIAALNAVILVGIVKILRAMRSGRYSDEELERQLDNRGLMNRIFGGYAKRIDAPWKMYPVGVLFGLGFDTATEVGLLVMAGTAVVSGLPFYAILSLPILFAGGMCLFDTIDGCFMNFAYDWAFARPVRKVFYNLTITGLSVFVAFFIGTIEILGLIEQEYRLSGGFWSFMGNFDINKAGFVIVGMFVVTWAIALSVWHFGRIEQRWDLAAAAAAARDLELSPAPAGRGAVSIPS